MFFEHWIYSAAIAIVGGMVYYRVTGRDYAWIILISASVPDVDVVADTLLKKVGTTVLIDGNPINHGYFHNLAVLLLYACAVAFVLHPMGIKLKDSFFFASISFAAHLFEDALVFSHGYRFLWPLSIQRYGIGIFAYTRDWYGVGGKDVLLVGLILVLLSASLRTAYEGTGWLKRSVGLIIRPHMG